MKLGEGDVDVKSERTDNSLTAVAMASNSGHVTLYVVSQLSVNAPLLSADQSISFDVVIEQSGIGVGVASIMDTTGGGSLTILERQISSTERVKLKNGHTYKVEVNAQVYSAQSGDGFHKTKMSLFIDPEVTKLHFKE